MTVHAAIPDAPPGGLATVDGRFYPLEWVRVDAHAEAGLASTRLTQSFANPYDEALEVVYTLPLPADGAVVGYTIRIGDRVIRSEVQPRETAERAYREALYSGRTAGLLEADRADTFQQRLGNLPPRTPAEVEIELLHPLAFLPGAEQAAPRWEYRFPTVVSVRYHGEMGRVPDAERLSPGRDIEGGIPTRADLALTVVPEAADAVPLSPSHEVRTAATERGWTVVFEGPQQLDRDIVVRWEAGTAEVGVRVTEGAGLAGDDGRYALVSVTPPQAPDAALPRDLIVLLDASGSMGGAALHQAKTVVEGLLRSLAPEDRFEVLAFANEVSRIGGPAPGSDERALARARRALTELRAGGATEMQGALRTALAPLRPDAQRQVVLITDGCISFEDDVVAEVLRGLPAASRLHVVGVGAAPNRSLTWALARAARGLELMVANEAQAREAADRLCAGTARPVLTGVRASGTALVASAPARPRDVFAGQPAALAVELCAQGGTLTIDGELAGSRAPFHHEVVVPPRAAGPALGTPLPIGARFGREAIADVEMEAVGLTDGRLLDLRIEALGMRHRIASRRTSLVAIAEEPAVDPNLPSRRERLAVELPYGVSAAGVGLGMGMDVAMAMSRTDLQPCLGSPQYSSRKAMSHFVARSAYCRYGAVREESGSPLELSDGRFIGEGMPAGFEAHRERRTGPPVTVEAWVVQVEDAWLVVEFEVPDDAWWSPMRVPIEQLVLVEPARADDASDRAWRTLALDSVKMESRIHPGQRPVRVGTRVTYAIGLPEGYSWRSVRQVVIVCDAMPTRLVIALPTSSAVEPT